MDFTADHYYWASVERMSQAQHLYRQGEGFYALAMYAAGLAVECQGERITGCLNYWEVLDLVKVGAYDSLRTRPFTEERYGPIFTGFAQALHVATRPPAPASTRHLLIDIVDHRHLCRHCDADSIGNKVVTFGQRDAATGSRRFLRLPHGIPSHDTFERSSTLDPQPSSVAFVAWTQTSEQRLGRNTSPSMARPCGVRQRPAVWAPLHLVSAWATKSNLTLGQVAVDEKSNEITAIPQLLAICWI